MFTKEVAFEDSETLEVQAMHNQIEIRMNKLCFLIGIPFINSFKFFAQK